MSTVQAAADVHRLAVVAELSLDELVAATDALLGEQVAADGADAPAPSGGDPDGRTRVYSWSTGDGEQTLVVHWRRRGPVVEMASAGGAATVADLTEAVASVLAAGDPPVAVYLSTGQLRQACADLDLTLPALAGSTAAASPADPASGAAHLAESDATGPAQQAAGLLRTLLGEQRSLMVTRERGGAISSVLIGGAGDQLAWLVGRPDDNWLVQQVSRIETARALLGPLAAQSDHDVPAPQPRTMTAEQLRAWVAGTGTDAPALPGECVELVSVRGLRTTSGQVASFELVWATSATVDADGDFSLQPWLLRSTESAGLAAQPLQPSDLARQLAQALVEASPGEPGSNGGPATSAQGADPSTDHTEDEDPS